MRWGGEVGEGEGEGETRMAGMWDLAREGREMEMEMRRRRGRGVVVRCIFGGVLVVCVGGCVVVVLEVEGWSFDALFVFFSVVGKEVLSTDCPRNNIMLVVSSKTSSYSIRCSPGAVTVVP